MPHPTENAAPKGARSPRPATEPQGPTGVLRTLVEQHRQLSDSMRRAVESTDATQRQKVWMEVRRQLLSHERAEELEVYAALEGYDAGRDIIERHARDAGELESTINELELIDYASDEWAVRVRDVQALVKSHIEEEEADFFPRARELLGDQTIGELDERFIGAQRDLINTLV